jgi:hypothetical protein
LKTQQKKLQQSFQITEKSTDRIKTIILVSQ